MSLNSATVRLVTSSSIKASVNTGGGQIQATSPITLTATGNRLDSLADVVESSPVNGATLVYRSSDDKYVVQQLSLENVSGALDGGSF
jgi:hypothetical protein